MNKRLFILAFSLIIWLFCFDLRVLADDIIINEDTELEKYSSEQYIPTEIEDILSENGVSDTDNIEMTNVLEIVGSYIKSSFSKYSGYINLIMIMIFLSSVIKRSVRSERFMISEGYVTSLVHIVAVFGVFSEVVKSSEAALASLTDILGLTLPSLYAILLSSGCTVSAIVSGASVGVALSFINDIIMRFIAPLVYILMVIMLFEKMTSYLSDTGIFKVAKNTVMNTLKFITTLLLSVMSFQSILGASKDSLGMRTIRFAATNFIPIVGGAVSESMRTVSAGFKLLRTSVGGTFIFAMVLTALPIITDLLLLKTVFGMFSMFCGLLGAGVEKSLYDSAVDILNIINAIIIFTLLVSLLSMILFITTGFITSY